MSAGVCRKQRLARFPLYTLSVHGWVSLDRADGLFTPYTLAAVATIKPTEPRALEQLRKVSITRAGV